jgi:urease gamma subunit
MTIANVYALENTRNALEFAEDDKKRISRGLKINNVDTAALIADEDSSIYPFRHCAVIAL